jgi:hypothetical protein
VLFWARGIQPIDHGLGNLQHAGMRVPCHCGSRGKHPHFGCTFIRNQRRDGIGCRLTRRLPSAAASAAIAWFLIAVIKVSALLPQRMDNRSTIFGRYSATARPWPTPSRILRHCHLARLFIVHRGDSQYGRAFSAGRHPRRAFHAWLRWWVCGAGAGRLGARPLRRHVTSRVGTIVLVGRRADGARHHYLLGDPTTRA